MSGHSKWANIKRTKEKVDAKRGKFFTKIGKELAVAVKMGGGADPISNPRLANIIQKAKAINMPNDNIQRILKRASGENNNANYEDILYEGYGIGGSAVLVYTLTDNKNRTAGDVRHCFDKFGGSLGNSNCVSFLFNRRGVLVVEKTDSINEDDIMMFALENDAEDVCTQDEVFEIYFSSTTNMNSVKDIFEKAGYIIISAETEMVATNTVDLTEEQFETFTKMIDALEDMDDVQEVFHNVN